MNNSNSSPVNDWLILLGVVLSIALLSYALGRLLWKIYRLLHRRKAAVHVVDISNVIVLNANKRNVQRS